MTTIGLCHYQVGGTDGVSLEMDKWRQVLEGMGHTVYLCGGDLGMAEGFLIEELYHHREDVERITRNAFYRLSDYESEADLEKEILELADRIERGLRAFIDEFSLDLLIPNNIWSIGANLPAAIAFARVVRELRIPAIAHHHDFYWETFRGMTPTCAVVRRIAREYLAPKDPLVTHVVINSLVQAELRKRNGVESSVVPNVFGKPSESPRTTSLYFKPPGLSNARGSNWPSTSLRNSTNLPTSPSYKRAGFTMEGDSRKKVHRRKGPFATRRERWRTSLLPLGLLRLCRSCNLPFSFRGLGEPIS
jgi:hypothetical protein